MERMIRMGLMPSIPSKRNPLRKADLIRADIIEKRDEALDAGDLEEYERLGRELAYHAF